MCVQFSNYERMQCLSRKHFILSVGDLSRSDGIHEVVRVDHIKPSIENVQMVLHSSCDRIVTTHTNGAHTQSLGGGDAVGKIGAIPLIPVVEFEQDSALEYLGRGGDHPTCYSINEVDASGKNQHSVYKTFT